MAMTLFQYCMENHSQDILEQWDKEKNIGISMNEVSYGSHVRVWWRCKEGHCWQTKIYNRTSGNSGCPICQRKRSRVHLNDLASQAPELAKQWHPTKNGSITPNDVLAGTPRKVWWKGPCGHEWEAAVMSRTAGSGCPVCAGRTVVPGINDLASFAPDIVCEWNSNRNGSTTPEMVSPYANRKVWWRCELGHEYQAEIRHRTVEKSGCPYCTGRKVLAGFNDLATKEPKIAAQWHPELNGALTPEMVSCGSNKKVWWQCADGHVWKAVIYSRTGEKKSGCPVCAGKTKRQAI